MSSQHFLTLMDFTPQALEGLLERARELKAMHRRGEIHEPLKNRSLAMIFEKHSTRTRVSFEAGMVQLGGHALFLSPRDTQLGRGEPVEDTARVLAQMVDAVMVRNDSHELLRRLARASRVPVINALTDLYHPCQLLADMQTFQEHRGAIRGRTVAWTGDGNNVCHSYINGVRQFGYRLRIATPPGYEPDAEIVKSGGDAVTLTRDPAEAVAGADLVVTDVWASMGQEGEQDNRAAVFQSYQVNAALMAGAAQDALFMHCLPAHRGEEVTNEVLEGPQSVVWEEAGNRLHAQKALLERLIQ